MRYALILAALLGVSLPSASAWAQTTPAVEQRLLDERFAELVDWLKRYQRWEAWTLRWGNRIARNAAGGIHKNRPARPEPPTWLADDCRQLLPSTGALSDACAVLTHWESLGQHLITQRRPPTAPPTDVPVKASFLQRVHLSGGWVPAQLPAPQLYLVAGMQVGIVELGRVTLPAVGVGLIVMADGQGGYEWKPASLIGIGYRLASFPFPGIKRQAHLHFNIARAIIHGTSTIPLGLDPSQNLIGMSLTFNKAR